MATTNDGSQVHAVESRGYVIMHGQGPRGGFWAPRHLDPDAARQLARELEAAAKEAAERRGAAVLDA